MHNKSALKLSRAGCESVNQHTRLSAEDCGTEVLTLQRQSTGGVCVCVSVWVEGFGVGWREEEGQTVLRD